MTTKNKNNILAVLTVLLSTFIPAIILGKILEGVVFIICHTVIRPQFKRQYHSIVPSICRTITASVFFFGATFVLPFELSLFSAIPINYLISWVGCIKASERHYKILCNELREKYCNDKEKLLRKCRLAKLSERDTVFAYMYYYEHKTPKEIWLWQCEQYKYEAVEWQTIYQTLWRIGNKLNKVEDL